jgi:Zn-dependent protease
MSPLNVITSDPILAVLLVIAFIAALSVHEGNHALVATALGDDTPRRAGRLSLNPMRHVDLTGLVVFILAGFGWAWTPVNPQNLKPNPRVGNAIVAAAGPLANLLLAIALSIPLRMALDLPPDVVRLLRVGFFLNVILFCLNLIPLPPLDGFTVLLGLLPQHLAVRLKQLERYGPGLLLLVLLVGPMLGFNILGPIIRPVARIIGGPYLGF